MPYADPEKQRAYQQKWDRENLDKKLKSRAARRRAMKKRLWEFKKTLKCARCPERHPACLDFHHKKPSEKSFAIGEVGARTDVGWETVLKEIKKCIVLCANCHRKAHHSGV